MCDYYFFKIFGQVTFFSLKNGMKSWCYPLLVHEKILYLYNSYSLQKPAYYLRDHQSKDHWMNHILSTSGVIHWWTRRQVD